MKLSLTLIALALSLMALNLAQADDAGQFAPLTEISLADGREVVADVNGKVAYTFDVDDVNTSSCYDKCAKTWPPILVKSAEGILKPMGVSARKDGALQLTLNGQPLYFFAGDQFPGDINGDGLGGVWHIIVD